MKKSPHGEYIGAIYVDSGSCWVGDPCHVIHQKGALPKSFGKTWDEFVTKLHRFKSIKTEVDGHQVKIPHFAPLNAKQFKDETGVTLGLCVPTGVGDGVYPVYIRKGTGEGYSGVRVKSVTVVFIDEEETE